MQWFYGNTHSIFIRYKYKFIYTHKVQFHRYVRYKSVYLVCYLVFLFGLKKDVYHKPTDQMTHENMSAIKYKWNQKLTFTVDKLEN